MTVPGLRAALHRSGPALILDAATLSDDGRLDTTRACAALIAATGAPALRFEDASIGLVTEVSLADGRRVPALPLHGIAELDGRTVDVRGHVFALDGSAELGLAFAMPPGWQLRGAFPGTLDAIGAPLHVFDEFGLTGARLTIATIAHRDPVRGTAWPADLALAASVALPARYAALVDPGGPVAISGPLTIDRTLADAPRLAALHLRAPLPSWTIAPHLVVQDLVLALETETVFATPHADIGVNLSRASLDGRLALGDRTIAVSAHVPSDLDQLVPISAHLEHVPLADLAPLAALLGGDLAAMLPAGLRAPRELALRMLDLDYAWRDRTIVGVTAQVATSTPWPLVPAASGVTAGPITVTCNVTYPLDPTLREVGFRLTAQLDFEDHAVRLDAHLPDLAIGGWVVGGLDDTHDSVDRALALTDRAALGLDPA
ncbi:MAG: hypothetical protein K8W52_09890 [Deltaproteobacteria bacterium]|nr:hypothetical protein [Deltaproteobacteria bacterium]